MTASTSTRTSRFLFILTIILLVVSDCNCSSDAVTPYRLGNFAYVPAPPPPAPSVSTLPTKQLHKLSQVWEKHIAHYFRIGVFIYYSRGAITSIYDDSWEAIRDPTMVFGKQIRREEERKVVQKRTRHAERLRAFVGAGYTPRLVWLFGLMLRGIIHCTDLPIIFEPPIGFGAGAVAAARYAHREWLPCIMLGWYGSGFYWRTLFGVDGSPKSSFDGVPIKIRHVRF